MERASGILLPVFSLPSEYGIGCFSKDAYEFVDHLVEAGQKYWQILPLGPTGYGDSPYQSFSTFAGNPYFIDPCTLIEEGLLEKEECDSFDFVSHINYVEYDKIYNGRFTLLRMAYNRFLRNVPQEFEVFCKEQKHWLEDYCLFMAIKTSVDSASWMDWQDDIRIRDKDTLAKLKKQLADEMNFFRFQQYKFFEQWIKLKNYANEKGIRIIGDVPIYVANDSADTWCGPELFQFDEEGKPKAVAGCPPDAFSATGQLWGNPLYDWEYHEKTEYAWWIKRIRHCFELYDVVRIDHFRAFDAYYSIPAQDDTAEFGHYEDGPGMKLFKRLKKVLGELDIIAEDLGFLTPSVYELLEESGYPGMKVLQFAFDESEESVYLPHKYKENCIVYTGTHDNETSEGWYANISERERSFVNDYLGYSEQDEERFSMRLARVAMASRAKLCVVPFQDYLGLGNEARINHPSTVGSNWKWRASKGAFTPELAATIKRLTGLYGR